MTQVSKELIHLGKTTNPSWASAYPSSKWDHSQDPVLHRDMERIKRATMNEGLPREQARRTLGTICTECPGRKGDMAPQSPEIPGAHITFFPGL